MAVHGPILVFDGVCGLCHRAVQFVLRHDRERRFRFAPLQSEFAAELLRRHGRDARDLDTMYLVVEPGTPREQLFSKSDGVLGTLKVLGRDRFLAGLASRLPRRWRDRAYDVVARHRYRWFGRYDQCTIPGPELDGRFIGVNATTDQRQRGGAGDSAERSAHYG